MTQEKKRNGGHVRESDDSSLPNDDDLPPLLRSSEVLQFDSHCQIRNGFGTLAAQAALDKINLFLPHLITFYGIALDGSKQEFMRSEYDEQRMGACQIAFAGTEKIAEACLQCMGEKTVVHIGDSLGNEYLLEDNLGKMREKLHSILPMSHRVAIRRRKRNMTIRKNGVTIGTIQAKRDLYQVDRVQELRKQMDLRLLLLGVVLKIVY